MNKQELIDKAIEDLNGKFKPKQGSGYFFADGYLCSLCPIEKYHYQRICDEDDFNQRAQELGWINGYKWGVEYATNGKKPDLPGDVVIEWFGSYGRWIKTNCRGLLWNVKDGGSQDISAFRIVDERYKPKAEQLDNSWHERGELPLAGTEVEVKHNGSWVGATVVGEFGTLKKCVVCAPNGGGFFGFYLDEIRLLKTEREKFIETFVNILKENPSAFTDEQIADLLYDIGFRAPEGLK